MLIVPKPSHHAHPPSVARCSAQGGITYSDYHQWLSGLSGDPERPLSASRIHQAHQCVGAVMKYAVKSGLVASNAIAGIESTDLPQRTERERRYLTHAELLTLA
jgi:hypothetical protein